MIDYSYVRRASVGAIVGLVVLGAGCRNSSLLNVENPVGFIPGTAINSPTGAAEAFVSARDRAAVAMDGGPSSGLLGYSEVLSDEMTAIANGFRLNAADARGTVFTPDWGENSDVGVNRMLVARSDLLLAEPSLATYAVDGEKAWSGEAYALAGYIDVLLAEDYCAGVPLSHAVVGGGVVFGHPLTTDSLIGVAEADFDSALAYAYGNDTVIALASVGLGRARLDSGNYAAAATAVQAVPTNFVYDLMGNTAPPGYGNTLQPNLYGTELTGAVKPCARDFNMSDREGGTGLNFVSAQDPRLVVDSMIAETCDGYSSQLPDSVWYYPAKFGNPAFAIPLATGVEARLIAAEAALQAGEPQTWANDLNALRDSAPQTYLQLDSAVHPLLADSTTGASAAMQVDVLFRERAFWLYGTGNRLGDLRRLVRQYERPANTVFPTGPYQPVLQAIIATNPNNYPILPALQYGNDVNLTLPTPPSGYATPNPYYRGGCLTSTTTA